MLEMKIAKLKVKIKPRTQNTSSNALKLKRIQKRHYKSYEQLEKHADIFALTI